MAAHNAFLPSGVQKRFVRSSLAIAVAMGLAACGGGGSSSSPTSSSPAAATTTDQTTQTTKTTLSGTVADGYLDNALVCLDVNANKACDSDEPQARSTAGGAFTLDATEAQIAEAALVVKTIANETIDEDNPGVPLDKGYVMTAPAGYKFVSPLSTMVQSHLEENKGAKLEDAEKEIKKKLGTEFDPKQDYVAGKNKDGVSDADKAEFKRLHKVAQVTAKVLANNMEKLETVASANPGLEIKALVEMIVAQVLNSLDTIRTEVAKVEPTAFDPSKLAVKEDLTTKITFNPNDPEAMQKQILVRQAEQQAVAANLGELLTGSGVNWFGGHIHAEPQKDGTVTRKAELDYGVVKFDQTTGVTSETHYQFDSATGKFVVDTETSDHKDWVLTANGWVVVGDDVKIKTINSDGSVVLENPALPGVTETVSGFEIKVEGLFIREFARQTPHGMAWGWGIPGDAKFSADARAYKIHSTWSQGLYQVWNWECPHEADRKNGNCNWVSLFNTTNPHERGALTSLDAVIVDQAADLSNIHTLKGVEFDHDRRSENGKEIETMMVAEFVKDGTLNFYKVLRTWTFSGGETGTTGTKTAMMMPEPVLTFEKVDSRTWELKTVEGQQIAVFAPPHRQMDKFQGDGTHKAIMAVVDGYVRMGNYESSDNVDRELIVNSKAMEEMLQNFNAELLKNIPAPGNGPVGGPAPVNGTTATSGSGTTTPMPMPTDATKALETLAGATTTTTGTPISAQVDPAKLLQTIATATTTATTTTTAPATK